MTKAGEQPTITQALKPCPFCKSEAKHFERHNPMSKWRHSVDCEKCGASGPVEATKAEAISAWNTRTTSLAAQDLGTYDAGLLNDYGGGDVDWWQDYIRAELGRAHDFYTSQTAPSLAAQDGLVEALEKYIGNAHHLDGCSAYRGSDCSCGLDELQSVLESSK